MHNLPDDIREYNIILLLITITYPRINMYMRVGLYNYIMFNLLKFSVLGFSKSLQY
jgi:hypothetical protein